MDQPAKHMTIELGDEDIHSDVVSILDSMSSIRQEQLTDNRVSDETKNEYLHLTCRLASCMQATADDGLRDKMQATFDALVGNAALMTYDYSQGSFWRRVDPNFSKNLESATICLIGDDFRGLEDSHHIWNASKYIWGNEASEDDRLGMYDTVLPFSDPLNGDHVSQFSKGLRSALGSKDVRIDGRNLTLGSTPNDIDRVRRVAKRFGFRNLQMIVDGDDAVDNLKKDYGLNVMANDYRLDGDLKKGGGLSRFFGKAVKNTKFVSYPLLGLLPASIQRRIESRFADVGIKDSFNATYASAASNFSEMIGVPVGGIVMANTVGPWWAWIPTIAYSVANGIIRGINNGTISQESPVDAPTTAFGNSLLELAYLPVGKVVDKVVGASPYNDPILIRMSLEDEYNSKEDVEFNSKQHNYHPLMEDLASTVLDTELEGNLIWSLGNHHTQGRYFEAELRKKHDFGAFGRDRCLVKKAGTLILSDKTFFGPYGKVSALVCTPTQRFALTYVGMNTGRITDYKEVGNILAKYGPLDAKLTDLSEHVGAEYAHISHFDEGKKVGDLVSTGGVK
jgi:hypothetical protein